MVPPLQAHGFLLGQARPTLREFCLPTGVLIGLLGLGLWAFFWVKRWRQEGVANSTPEPLDHLGHFEKMAEDGLLDPQEFARIKEEMDRQSRSNADPGETSPPNDQLP